jgi:hypothetical protein
VLWSQYVFRRRGEVQDTWELMFADREVRLLYVVGLGFDIRAQTVLRTLIDSLTASRATVQRADLLLLSLPGYELDDDLKALTEENADALKLHFASLGAAVTEPIMPTADGEDDLTSTNTLRLGTEAVLARITDQTDIVLDVSSLPRVAYLALLTSVLRKLVPDKGSPASTYAGGTNFHVVVAEDPILDAQIKSEDPSNDLVVIPGFAGALQSEIAQDWPLVWFPILGENRVGQFDKVMSAAIPPAAEICPVLPHPSRDPRRADNLLREYKKSLFDSGQMLTSNVLYVHESNPFEAYRQLFRAMTRYKESLTLLGGCRLAVTPLGSKLITIGAGLACFEMNPPGLDHGYGVTIPYVEPTRYVVDASAVRASTPEITLLLLTGDAYRRE